MNDLTVTYHCRDCLSPFAGWPDAHPGDQYCEPCTRAQAERMAVAHVRQLNLEEMGFTPDEVEVKLKQWQFAEAESILETLADGD